MATGKEILARMESFVVTGPHHIEPNAVYSEEALVRALHLTDPIDIDWVLDHICAVHLPGGRLYLGSSVLFFLKELTRILP